MQLDQLRRRELLRLLGGAGLWPVVARAQQAGRLPTIGLLGASTQAAQSPWTAAFWRRMNELGWIEGRNIAMEYRWAEGREERYSEIAAELVRLKVDLIMTHGTQGALAAKAATSTIPIIAAVVGDPVGTGLVASLARPGANLTGLSVQSTDVATKRLELLREIVPGLRRLAILADIGNPVTAQELREVEATASAIGLAATALGIRRVEDIAPALAGLRGRSDALYVAANPLVLTNIVRINILAVGARQPTIYIGRDYVLAGGLMSYGPNFPDIYRRAADFAHKIMRGTKPADIPVEQPTKFDLVISLITAQALGLTVPATLLARADEVIE